jgi:outer membrane protein assembly factor BamB
MNHAAPRLVPLARIPAAIALAAAVIALIALVITLHAHLTSLQSDPLDPRHLAPLTASLRQAIDANDTAAADGLRQQIASVDLSLRQEFFTAGDRLRLSAPLLLISTALAIGAWKLSRHWRRLEPMPPATPPAMESAAMVQQRLGAARWSVMTAALVLVSTAGAWIVASSQPVGDDPLASSNPVTAADLAGNWHRFHGPLGDGTLAGADPPIDWDIASGRGVKWAVDVPLPGYGSPIVWGDRVFITGASRTAQMLYCHALADGRLLWSASITASAAGRQDLRAYDDNGFAAPTPITDGRRIFALFASGDLAAFSLDGQPLWTTALGIPRNSYGYASSPALCDDLLLIQWDNDDVHQLIALDTATGSERWRTNRPVQQSWSTPLIHRPTDSPQIITASIDGVIAHDPTTGHILWHMPTLEADGDGALAAGPIAISSSASASSSSSASSSTATSAAPHLLILDPGSNSITSLNPTGTPAFRTEIDPSLAGLLTPVTDGPLVYLIAANGFIAVEAATGKVAWELEPEKEPYFSAGFSSPVLAGNRLYIADADGVIWIVQTTPAPRVIARHPIGQPLGSTPALAGPHLLLRTATRLLCLGPPTSSPSTTSATPPTEAAP